MKKYVKVYITAWVLVILFFAFCTVSIVLGSGNIRVFGAKIDISQGNYYELYKINDQLAFEINDDFISVVGYEKTSGLYAFAGKYQHSPLDSGHANDVYMTSADYMKDDYVYTAYPVGRTDIINLKTGEAISSGDSDDFPTDASQSPDYIERGLVFDEQYRLTPDQINQNYENLNTFNGNIFNLIISFIVILIIMILWGIPVIIKARKK